MRNPFRRVQAAKNEMPEVNISEENGIRSLHLGSPTIQSSMDMDDPTRLVLSYSRSMMAWLLFVDEVEQIVQVGLGGGSLARWIDCYLPEVKDTVIEINPQVVAVARSFFELPFDGEDEKLEIVIADGAEYIKLYRESVDVVLVDGFDSTQIVDDLVSEAFFQDCLDALSDKGVFVTNWWRDDKRFHVFITRLKAVFGDRVLEVPAENHGNVAVMAFKNTPEELDLFPLRRRAAKLSRTYHLNFEKVLTDICQNNLTSDQKLYFSD